MTALERARELVDSGDLRNTVFHWLECEDEGRESLVALDALAAIAAAGLALRESGGHPGSGTGDGSTFDGCVCFWCEAARAFDATVAGALGGGA